MSNAREPRYAYEDPAALAWTAQIFRTARRRRLTRIAAEEAAQSRPTVPAVGGRDADA